MESTYSLGILGMGVMGHSLALNFERNGYRVIGYDPYPNLPPGFPVKMAATVEEVVNALETPRVVLMMVPAGAPVDIAIKSLREVMQPGDIIIDGGNSYFLDTSRRARELESHGIHYIGMGVSGGESGALYGPSLMPGGSRPAWERVQPMLRAIAAKADDGEPCVAWMGPEGAGHYVKMVHNGIEYGDMELIAEVYDLLHRGAGLSNAALADLFQRWNEGPLHSYLIEITSKVLRHIDKETGKPLVDLILDVAGQKGTGRWTSQNALEIGAPTPTIDSAVVARLVSTRKETRAAVAQIMGEAQGDPGDADALTAAAEAALYASKITAYAQGIDLLQTAGKTYNWGLDIAAIVRVWRAGCIIRAALLEDIAAAVERHPDLSHLYLDDFFARAVRSRQTGWRDIVKAGVSAGIPLPAISSALAYFDAMRSTRLPANLIQGQRDFFGAHTFRRIDKDGIFHDQWGQAES